ncbi:MAG: PHP domain-containing protein, partial [Patescibacteria group bacterium]
AGTKSKKGKLLAAETEKDVFHVLGMDYVAPELRENRGEIEAAREHALPKLIEVKDLCGDLHAHSTVSDGVDTMTDMARAAQNAGLTYIVITDHASTIGLVKGIKERTVGDYLKKIDAVKRRVPGIHIIAGAEVDILETGQLYLSDAALSHLEWVVASVHSSFRQSEKEMTARILRAIQNPHVSMIGHPTARLLGRRAPVAFDTGAVFKAAAKAGVALEVSASPFRLDLDDIRAREAKEAGVELAIASDAHGVDGFDFRFGVGQARRGWLTKHDVLNALPWAEFKKRL